MSPRGVAIPDVNEQLFQAAERVLRHHGPDGLTSRAITSEAGVAKGLIHNHFRDLDDFLAALILDRSRVAAEETGKLPALAGTGTVSDNIIEALLGTLESHAFLAADLLASRPSLMARMHAGADGPPAVVHDVEHAFTAYLDAEMKLGRIASDTDTETLALVVVGTVHHLFLTLGSSPKDLRRRMQRIVNTLITGVTPRAD